MRFAHEILAEILYELRSIIQLYAVKSFNKEKSVNLTCDFPKNHGGLLIVNIVVNESFGNGVVVTFVKFPVKKFINKFLDIHFIFCRRTDREAGTMLTYLIN